MYDRYQRFTKLCTTMTDKHLSIFFCAFLIAVAIRDISADEPEKLVGGHDIPIRSYPYTVSIRLNNNHLCGGAIIGPRHVLTAAHCLQPFTDRVALMTVVTGTHSVRFGGHSHKVSNIFYHKQFKADPKMGNSFDIGVLKLADEIKFNGNQSPVALPTTDLPIGNTVVVTAWGAISSPRGPLSENLQKLDLPTIPPNECQRFHSQRITYTQFCTLKAPGQGTCSGDSGSPLVYNGCVVGVVSNGIPCARGIPDVHTNVYQMRKFIDEALTL